MAKRREVDGSSDRKNLEGTSRDTITFPLWPRNSASSALAMSGEANQVRDVEQVQTSLRLADIKFVPWYIISAPNILSLHLGWPIN